jgi:hypothetical protein
VLKRRAALAPAGFALATVMVASGAAAAASTRAPRVHPHTCSPCTYTVTPNGTGAQNIAYVLANLVHANDTVVLTDGVYPVDNLQVSQPHVRIKAEHVTHGFTPPFAWLDGSIPYRYWSQPHPGLWQHTYSKDFCNTTLLHQPCDQLGLPYHADQVFKGNLAVPQTLTAGDLSVGLPVFYVDAAAHQLDINFDPGTDTTVTDKETALVFNTGATGSVLEGIGVRKYAGNDHNASDLAIHQNAAVYVDRASLVTLDYDSFSFNAVRGVKVQGDVPPAQTPVAGGGVEVTESTFDHNGELGLDAVDADGIILNASTYYRNNTKHYYFGSEAGGAKLLCTWGAQIRNNTFRANYGIGLWFDRSAYNATVENNLFQDNTSNGAKFEVSAHAVITGNEAIGNAQAAILVYESSQVSISHNLLRGNLVGIEIQEGTRTWANNPANHDSDPDRIHPADLTFDVKDIDIHANGFYYAPSPHTYIQCDPSSTTQMALDGCQYQIAVEDDLAQRDASVLGVTTARDNFHRQGWPSDPLHAKVPVFIALWQARPMTATAGGCVTNGGPSLRVLRWQDLADFQCTGQEVGAATPF